MYKLMRNFQGFDGFAHKGVWARSQDKQELLDRLERKAMQDNAYRCGTEAVGEELSTGTVEYYIVEES